MKKGGKRKKEGGMEEGREEGREKRRNGRRGKGRDVPVCFLLL